MSSFSEEQNIETKVPGLSIQLFSVTGEKHASDNYFHQAVSGVCMKIEKCARFNVHDLCVVFPLRDRYLL